MSETATQVESPTAQEKDPKSKIPGLEVTWEQADTLEWDDSFVTMLQSAKKQHTNIHTIQIADRWYVVRSLNRREYRTLVQQQAEVMSKEVEAAQEGGNAEGIRATLSMISEEAIATQGTVYPRLDQDSIRSKPSGVATTLHDTILLISGYQNQPMPIKV